MTWARLWGAVATALLLLLAPGQVKAHTALVGTGDFYAGLLHPITAFEHVVPLLALGLLAGQQQDEPRAWASLVCAAAVPVGAILAAVLQNLSWVQYANAATAMLMGIFVAAAWRPPAPLLLRPCRRVGRGPRLSPWPGACAWHAAGSVHRWCSHLDRSCSVLLRHSGEPPAPDMGADRCSCCR